MIFILLDGLGYGAALQTMCYLSSLCQTGSAQSFKLESQLPPLSRPVYATLLTGLPPAMHGIWANDSATPLPKVNIFAQTARKQLTTAAAAYSWIFELCEGVAYNADLHRHWDCGESAIQHGLFYASDAYPDAELFADGQYLLEAWRPDLLLIHAMGIDYAGHQHGADSPQYLAAAAACDQLLARYCPKWLASGHDLLICSDHGMDKNGCHYSVAPEVMEVPLWLAGKGWPAVGEVTQCGIAGLARENLKVD